SVSTTDDEALAAEIQRSLAVVRWTAVDAIWRSGDGGETDAAATGSPLAALGAPVSAPPYTGRARALLDQIGDPEPGASELAAAAALAADRRTRPLNLLPARLRPRRLTRQQIGALGALAAALILGIAALLIPGYQETRRLAKINARIVALDGQV